MPAQRQQLLRHDLGWQLAQPHRGQLQGQRQPIQRHTQRRQRQEIVIGQLERRVGRTHPRQQQLHGRRLSPGRGIGRLAQVGRGQRRQRPFLLAVQIQRHAAGAKQLQMGRPAEPIGEEGRAFQHVLAVIDHQQQAARGQVGFDGLPGDWPAEGVMPNVRRTTTGTSPAAATSARGTKATPSAKQGMAWFATSRASRLLPIPGAPTIVRRRALSSKASRSATSPARPISGSSGVGGRCAGAAGATMVSLVSWTRAHVCG